MMRFLIYFVLCIIAKEIVPNFDVDRMLTIGTVAWFLSHAYHAFMEDK